MLPVATTDNHTSTYAGGQVSFSANMAKNDLQAGFYGFHQNDNQLFGIIFNDGSNSCALFAERDTASGGRKLSSSTTNSNQFPG